MKIIWLIEFANFKIESFNLKPTVFAGQLAGEQEASYLVSLFIFQVKADCFANSVSRQIINFGLLICK